MKIHQWDCLPVGVFFCMEIFSKVKYLDKDLRSKVGQDANKKFGEKNSYVKNLWILREYKKRGGKVRNIGDKPSKEKIKKQISESSSLPNDKNILEYIFSKEIEEFQELESEISDLKKILESDFNQETIDNIIF